MVTAAVTVSLPRAVVVLEVEALEAEAAADAGEDVGRMLRSSTTSSYSVVSTTVSGSTGLPTTDPTRFYVGVLAQEVQKVMPEAVERGRDGYLRVHYEMLACDFRLTGSGPRPTPVSLSQRNQGVNELQVLH